MFILKKKYQTFCGRNGFDIETNQEFLCDIYLHYFFDQIVCMFSMYIMFNFSRPPFASIWGFLLIPYIRSQNRMVKP